MEDTDEKVALSERFELKECSSDLEVADPRTDSRSEMHFQQPRDTFKELNLKPLKDLTEEEICSIYDHVFIRETSWINGCHLINCFYDFTPTHDLEIAKENPFIEKLVLFSHTSMENISSIIYGVLEHGFNKFDDFQSSYIKFFNDLDLAADANAEVQDLIAKYKSKVKKIKSKNEKINF